MQYVYVLSSQVNDYYAEQACVSIYSLKKFNPDSNVILIGDIETIENLKNGRELVKTLINDIIPVKTPEGFTLLQKSRFIKTSIRQIIPGDFIFIDTDTIILGSLKELEETDCKMGAVTTKDSRDWNRKNPHKHFREYNEKRGINPDFNHGIDYFYNSGVMLCRDKPEVYKLFDRWHSLWIESSVKYGYHKDQCDLDRANSELENIIKNIDGIYNFAAIYPNVAIEDIKNCKIFHYFVSSNKLKNLKIKDFAFLERLKRNGLSPEIDDMIENIKLEYLQNIYKERDIFFNFKSLSIGKKETKIRLYLRRKMLCFNIYRKLIHIQRSLQIKENRI